MKNCFHIQKTVFVQTVINEYIIISICFPVCHNTTVQLFSITQIQFHSTTTTTKKSSQSKSYLCVFLLFYETLVPC